MDIIIPENAGLGELRQLLAQAENQLSDWQPKLTQYRIDATTAKTNRDYQLAVAKVKNQGEKSPTMMNAKAACDPDVRSAQMAYNAAEAIAGQILPSLMASRMGEWYLGTTGIWVMPMADCSYECQVEVKPIQNGKQENDIQVDIHFQKSELHQRLCGTTFHMDDTSCG